MIVISPLIKSPRYFVKIYFLRVNCGGLSGGVSLLTLLLLLLLMLLIKLVAVVVVVAVVTVVDEVVVNVDVDDSEDVELFSCFNVLRGTFFKLVDNFFNGLGDMLADSTLCNGSC